jgi:hypothetical protein
VYGHGGDDIGGVAALDVSVGIYPYEPVAATMSGAILIYFVDGCYGPSHESLQKIGLGS